MRREQPSWEENLITGQRINQKTKISLAQPPPVVVAKSFYGFLFKSKNNYMLAYCKTSCISEEQKRNLGMYSKGDFHITEGKQYLVFGLTFLKNGDEHILNIEILSDYNHLISVPAIYFEFTDSRVSKYWEIKMFDDGSITLWPNSFYKEFYHEDLFEEVQENIEDFKHVKKCIEDEFNYIL
ncbi:hypothetical protein ACFOW1_12870 [Parasediminibacterium paludis]|uniref:DUF402 domain-containing protein n=1 Tax=Parasediminibacterium paludis TaxID=908966 RepID=A0ABV8Q0P5_9BACT